MTYDRIEPAAWWHGAEAAPPMPPEPGPWALVWIGRRIGTEANRANQG